MVTGAGLEGGKVLWGVDVQSRSEPIASDVTPLGTGEKLAGTFIPAELPEPIQGRALEQDRMPRLSAVCRAHSDHGGISSGEHPRHGFAAEKRLITEHDNCRLDFAGGLDPGLQRPGHALAPGLADDRLGAMQGYFAPDPIRVRPQDHDDPIEAGALDSGQRVLEQRLAPEIGQLLWPAETACIPCCENDANDP